MARSGQMYTTTTLLGIDVLFRLPQGGAGQVWAGKLSPSHHQVKVRSHRREFHARHLAVTPLQRYRVRSPMHHAAVGGEGDDVVEPSEGHARQVSR